MTCIVGLEYEDGVIIGGDSAATGNGRIQLTTTPKVFKLTTDPELEGQYTALLIGYTWSFRMGQIIQHSQYAPRTVESESNYEYLINKFVPFLRGIFKDAGWLKIEDEREEGGEFLVGIRGQLFRIEWNFSVLRMSNGYDAVGSGAPYALGTIHILKEKVNQYSDVIQPPTYLVELALQAAANYSTSVSAPFTIRKIHNDG